MRLLLLFCVFFSMAARADYHYEGQLQLQVLNGELLSQPFEFSLKQMNQNYQFTIGAQTARLTQPPQRYSVALVLQKEQEVWVSDFTDKPLEAFTLALGDHVIRLEKNAQAKAARGNYILTVGEQQYYFGRGPAQLNFILSPTGISDVEVRGMFKPRR